MELWANLNFCPNKGQDQTATGQNLQIFRFSEFRSDPIEADGSCLGTEAARCLRAA